MNSIVYLLFIILKNTIPLFPLSFVQFIAKLKGKLFYYILPIRKKTAFQNLKIAFPEKSDKEIKHIIKRCYVNIITVIAEFFYFPKLNKESLSKLINLEHPELFKEKLKQGKGLIIISAHFGNWELMAYGVSQLSGYPFNVIVKEQSNKIIDKEINRVREMHGNKMIDMSHAMREVLSLLKQNKVIAMLSDQSAPKENIKVNFFIPGVPVFEGAARFAIKTGAPVIFGIPFRNKDNSYFVKLFDIDLSKYKEYNEENIMKLTQEHTKILEYCIRQSPDHWLWFHRRFKNIEGIKID